MNTEVANDAERKAVVGICVLAAFADGMESEVERKELERVVEKFQSEGVDLTAPYREALGGTQRLSELAKMVESVGGKSLAYEMAVCICNADGGLNAAERQFLEKLKRELNLDAAAVSRFENEPARIGSQGFAVPPVLATMGSITPGAGSSELDESIRNRAILAGALELMPQRLAAMAIVPLQMQLVYSIGKSHGYDLDWGHAKEFMATVGVGMTSQVVEGYLSKLVGSMTRKFAGKLVGGLLSQATESAFAFATTYAIGHAAKSYYTSGRTLSTEQLRQVFSTMLQQGQSMKSQFAGEIAQRSSTLKVSDFLPLVKEKIGPLAG